MRLLCIDVVVLTDVTLVGIPEMYTYFTPSNNSIWTFGDVGYTLNVCVCVCGVVLWLSLSA